MYSELQACVLLPLEGNKMGRKTNTQNNTSDKPILMHIHVNNYVNMKFNILARSWKIEKLQTKWQNVIYSPFLIIFNEHIHSNSNQSFQCFLDVSKDDSAFKFSEKWFKMWRPNTLKLSSSNVKWCNVKAW